MRVTYGMEHEQNKHAVDSQFLARDRLPLLLQVLVDLGYHCIGPHIKDGVVVYGELQSVDQLPSGFIDHQQPGQYRLSQTDSPRCFSWANGPQALKPLLFTPRETLWQVQRIDGRLQFTEVPVNPRATAVIGLRACDLAALRLQDAHFLKAENPDPYYRQRREQLLLIAVNCSFPAATCFCDSTGDGPVASTGYDLVLTELDDGYLLQAGSGRGDDILARLPLVHASREQLDSADRELQAAAARQVRRLPSRNLKDSLFARLEHARWDDVAGRCLSCGNCTSVCPTCFCYSEADESSMDGHSSEHYRQWDSCFTHGHSYIHGLVVHSGTRERYRQWLTHKLGSWHDQYGRSGCVGCGRCLTWCPVGIDITEEVEALCHEP